MNPLLQNIGYNIIRRRNLISILQTKYFLTSNFFAISRISVIVEYNMMILGHIMIELTSCFGDLSWFLIRWRCDLVGLESE